MQMAHMIKQNHVQHRASNTVQVGHLLQLAFELGQGMAEPDTRKIAEAQETDRTRLMQTMNRVVRKIAARRYEKKYDHAYKKEVLERFNVKGMDEIRGTWSIQMITFATAKLQARLRDVMGGGVRR